MEKHIKILKQLLIIHLNKVFVSNDMTDTINDKDSITGRYFIQRHIFDYLK